MKRDALDGQYALIHTTTRAVVGACCDLLRQMESLAPITNQQLRSDLAIAAILTEGAAKSGWWNVKMNVMLLSVLVMVQLPPSATPTQPAWFAV